MSRSQTLQRFLLPPAAATLALLLQVGSGQAQTGQTPSSSPGPARPQLTEKQKSELFTARRDMALRTHAAQIAILQKGQRCVTASRDLEAFQACRKEEWQAQRSLMASNREEARAVYQRLGLPVPEPRRKAGGPMGPPGAP